MVSILSICDYPSTGMWLLDFNDRGQCNLDKNSKVREEYPFATVRFSNIKLTEIQQYSSIDVCIDEK